VWPQHRCLSLLLLLLQQMLLMLLLLLLLLMCQKVGQFGTVRRGWGQLVWMICGCNRLILHSSPIAPPLILTCPCRHFPRTQREQRDFRANASAFFSLLLSAFSSLSHSSLFLFSESYLNFMRLCVCFYKLLSLVAIWLRYTQIINTLLHFCFFFCNNF